ncbi:histidine kinase [Microbacterium sp. NPDC056044]|uniref:sensor histidine kinase n=1 Tax=Microbacterium sp. NPDC056044 TaxID=3345690 RepID=UPI0035D79286
MSDTSSPLATASRSRRRPTAATIMFGALALAAVVLFSVLVPLHITLYHQPAPFAFLFGAMLCASPVLAVRFPRWSIVLATVAAVALPLPGGQPAALWPWPWSVPAMLAFILFIGVLAIMHGWRFALAAWLLGIGGTLAVVLALAAAVPVVAGIVNLVIVTSVSGAALLVAVLVASRLRVGAELTRERELSALEQSRRVLVEERTRIARELHDVVAHGMSLIQVQASTARYRVAGLSDEAVREFDEIAQTAREGLTEMRRLLGVLRTDDQQAALAPQQGLGDIPDLVEALRRAGATIDAALAPVPETVPTAVDIAAFRITQEALSNAVRHAPHARIELSTETDAATLRLVVHNAATGDAADPGSSTPHGHGLLGMRERAALVGGRVSAGPDPDGGWTVRAALPLAPLPPDPMPGGAP